MPPVAPGPFVPDAFAGNGNGRGITWGLFHVDAYSKEGIKYCKLTRFDCDLSLDVDRPELKRNNLRFNEEMYFMGKLAMPESMKKQVLEQQEEVDRNTIIHE